MSSRSGDRKAVLVVEDDKALSDAISEFLTDEGFDVETAANGQIAIERLRAGLRPAAVILDLLMPEMDGAAFRSAQLSDPALRAIPLAVFTGSSVKAETVTARFPGVDVLRKPLDAADLASLVRRLAQSPNVPEE